MKKFLVILLTGSLILANSAFAGRIGGGRNSGMQRSVSPSSNYSNKNSGYSTSPQPTSPGNAGQQRPGMGAGTAALLGAAAGAAGGYMLGKSGNNPNASGVTSSGTTSAIPWGTIAILIAILALGLMFFRKKTSPGLSSGSQMNNYTPSNSGNFNIPNINRNNNTAPANPTSRFGRQSAPAPTQMDKMPDGIETIYFLRQVKGMFLHIQSMNNPDNLSEIQKYMTSELFTATQKDISANLVVADFTNLDCMLLQSETIGGDDKKDDQGNIIEAQIIASVKFFGMVSENPEEEPKPFSEIWNFVKSASTNNKWLAAGIQQETLNK